MNIDAVGAPAPPAPPPCQNPTVDLHVTKNLLTLKHDRANRLWLTITPAACRATEYKIEIQRAAGGAWFPLARKRSYLWLARVAGKFKLRGVAKINGADVQSATKDVEVQFPTYAEIVGDPVVRRATLNEWRRTLRECTRNPNRRRERGFWIRINTRANRYIFTDRATGGWVGPGAGASVNLIPRPPDTPANPDPNSTGAKYPVASFHTHTPTAYRPGPGTREIGPSGADNAVDNNDDVPGVVYDYVASTVSAAGNPAIPMGHPRRARAQLYHSQGRNRRSTP